MKTAVTVKSAVFALVVAVAGTTACRSAPDRSRCEAVPGPVMTAISAGLTVSGGGSLRNGTAVKSSAFEKVWFVAADIEGPGLGGTSDVGVWTTNNLDGQGVIYSANAVAEEFSSWGNPGRFSRSDDGFAEAEGCV